MAAWINTRCLASVTLLLSFSDCLKTNWFYELEYIEFHILYLVTVLHVMKY